MHAPAPGLRRMSAAAEPRLSPQQSTVRIHSNALQTSTPVRHAARPACGLLCLQAQAAGHWPAGVHMQHWPSNHHQPALCAVYVAVSGLWWSLLRTVLPHLLSRGQHVLTCACKDTHQLAADGWGTPLTGAALLGRHMLPLVQEGSKGQTSRQALLRFATQMRDAEPIAIRAATPFSSAPGVLLPLRATLCPALPYWRCEAAKLHQGLQTRTRWAPASRPTLLRMVPKARPTLLPLCRAEYEEDSEGSDVEIDSDEEESFSDSEDDMRMLPGKSRECLRHFKLQEGLRVAIPCFSERTGSRGRCCLCQ